MLEDNTTVRCELMVIGSGIAGMAAALFAANRGIDTVQAGITGEINFASGLIDLLGVHPVAEGKVWQNPWAALEVLRRDQPNHPYAKINSEFIGTALGEFTDFLATAGHPYRFHPNRNTQVLTPVGTVKTTYAVPESMFKGTQALAQRLPCLLIDIEGLKGYSARQIAEMQKKRWPDLRYQRIKFPGVSGEIYTEHLARSLESAATRQELAVAVHPHLQGVKMVGFPAILGIHRTREIVADLERMLDTDLFEVPTMPPAVTGLRMREAFERRLPQMGVRTFYQHRVFNAECREGQPFRLDIGPQKPQFAVRADRVILASGRFLGNGLKADRDLVHETIFGLPVTQPPARNRWHHKNFFDPDGHAINRSGLAIDAQFRPLVCDGQPCHPNLYAVGSILAHQDWIRQKCGSSLAISTAHMAVRAIDHNRGNDVV